MNNIFQRGIVTGVDRDSEQVVAQLADGAEVRASYLNGMPPWPMSVALFMGGPQWVCIGAMGHQTEALSDGFSMVRDLDARLGKTVVHVDDNLRNNQFSVGWSVVDLHATNNFSIDHADMSGGAYWNYPGNTYVHGAYGDNGVPPAIHIDVLVEIETNDEGHRTLRHMGSGSMGNFNVAQIAHHPGSNTTTGINSSYAVPVSDGETIYWQIYQNSSTTLDQLRVHVTITPIWKDET